MGTRKTLKRFDKAVKDFGRAQYKNGRKVIAEGVQILDGGLGEKNSYFKGAPLVLLKTSALSSISRAFERDGRGNLITGLGGLESGREYVEWYFQMNRQISTMSNEMGARTGEAWVKQYLRSLENENQ